MFLILYDSENKRIRNKEKIDCYTNNILLAYLDLMVAQILIFGCIFIKHHSLENMADPRLKSMSPSTVLLNDLI